MIEGIVIIIQHDGQSHYFVSTLQGIFKPTNNVYHSRLETKKQVMVELTGGGTCKIVSTINVSFHSDIQTTLI